MASNNPKIKQCHKVLQQLSPDKLVAIRFILAFSKKNHVMDHLIDEGIAYVKNQEVENLADENSSSQSDVNYVNHPLIDFVKDEKDTCLTQDPQEDFDFIDSVEIELIEGKVDNYSIEHPITYACGEVDFQSIDNCETVKLQDVPIEVANEQEIEECIEEVVSDMTLPEVYRVDTEKTHRQLETPMIKSEEKCVMLNESKLVQDMALLHDTSTPLQTIAQPMKEQISLLDRALQGKLIPIKHASS